MAYIQLSQAQIIERENSVLSIAAATRKDPHRAILADRAARWKEHVSASDVRPEIVTWSATIVQRFGKKVRVHHNVVDWITALFIIRYGEAEYHWPMEFTDEDLQRATDLLGGRLGDAVELIPDAE